MVISPVGFDAIEPAICIVDFGLGQLSPSGASVVMSALAAKGDIRERNGNVSFVPESVIRSLSPKCPNPTRSELLKHVCCFTSCGG
jgi:hypothetical protein